MRCVLDIRSDGVRVRAALIDVFEGEVLFAEALACASEHRRMKALAYRFERDRQLSLLAGLLLDELLRERGLRERDMVYDVSDLGKPAFAAYPQLQFSLAHSGNMAVAALADVPVGVDVERLADFPRDVCDPHQWTEMEAVGKLLGSGVGCFVDSSEYSRPADARIGHFESQGHLVCVASFDSLPV